ncbi:MAG TPA: regulatory protein RecX [Vicinamibacterales bacterium]|jgi:regulatory protein|nr:regulatory protein RecX [Vicinamibacterales bacterium]
MSSRSGERSAYVDALYLLSRRELSERQLRGHLTEREHRPDEIESAVARLRDEGSVDDSRVARAYARTALKIKGRGRLRIQRELHEIGIPKEIAAEALAETFVDVDERALIARALEKKLRGGRPVDSPAAYARMYQHLLRQGFSPAGVSAALKELRRKNQ